MQMTRSMFDVNISSKQMYDSLVSFFTPTVLKYQAFLETKYKF